MQRRSRAIKRADYDILGWDSMKDDSAPYKEKCDGSLGSRGTVGYARLEKVYSGPGLCGLNKLSMNPQLPWSATSLLR
jgi:hypothetical protein